MNEKYSRPKQEKETLLELVDRDIEKFMEDISSGDCGDRYPKELVELAEEIIDNNPEAFKSFL